MAKAKKASARRTAPRKSAKARKDLPAHTAAAVTEAIAKARKAAGKSGRDMDVHVHVGDVVMMGFDEAVDAEEWGMRETNNEIARGKGRGRGAARESDPQDEKNRKINRSIKFRKGSLKLEAVEQSRPARKKKAAKRAPAKTVKKASRRSGGRR